MVHYPILESIKEIQSQHGLKYDNYQRYRTYCSRRLHRIRKSLNVYQGIPSSAKARHLRGRKLYEVTNQMVAELHAKNIRLGESMLLIPLVLAERAWAYAMQLKQEFEAQPRKRYHLRRRLARAVKHAQRFEALCNDQPSVCDERTKLEAQAYSAHMTGLYHSEVANWGEAKESYLKAQVIYFKLCLSIKQDEVADHYRQRIEELKASLRYCAYSLGTETSYENVNIPSKLQFHDLAHTHIKDMAESDRDVEDETDYNDDDDDDDDEFQETQEDPMQIEDSRDQQQQSSSRVGGVTGLVKGWLGRGW